MEQQQQHAKVERFLKLGYSQGDILRVLESLRHDAQTNDILEELIKTCHTRSHGNRSIPGSPKLVSRGCSPCPSPTRAGPEREPASAFKPVVIDGSNVAMSHGNKKVFSCQGLQLAVNWFWDRGLRDITVFIPLWRKEQPRPETLITDQHILHELERRKILVYTPSRCVNGKRVVCYDDRYIVKLAFDSDGIIVSNDNYRDLQTENLQWKKFIEERLLMYTFANDKFMPPDDPLGRNGPNIDDFLRKKPWIPDNKQQHCPYGKKCTYGVKCKFYHPERANQSQLSVADELRDRARNLQESPSHSCSTPPPPLALSTEEHHHRELYPGLDVDEAFGSMESSLSRLYIQDGGSHSCSSGVASCSLGHDDYASFSGSSYAGSSHKLCPRGGSYYPQCCDQCRYGQWPGSMCPQHHHHHHHQHHQHYQQPAWSSCPDLPPHSVERSRPCSDRQYPGQACDRQTHSLPREAWARGPARGPASEQRSGLRSQLSTLYPQSTVEQVMNAYPHISDTFQLISLIQRSRNSHFP